MTRGCICVFSDAYIRNHDRVTFKVRCPSSGPLDSPCDGSLDNPFVHCS